MKKKGVWIMVGLHFGELTKEQHKAYVEEIKRTYRGDHDCLMAMVQRRLFEKEIKG